MCSLFDARRTAAGGGAPASRNAATLTQLAQPSRTVTVAHVAATRGAPALGDSRVDATLRETFWSRAAEAGTLVLFGGGIHGGAYFNDTWRVCAVRREERYALVATRVLLNRARARARLERSGAILFAIARLPRGPFRTVVSFV